MNGIISQEVAILLYELNIQPPTSHYYAIEKNILENVDYTYLRGSKLPKHIYYAYGDRTPKRLDSEYDGANGTKWTDWGCFPTFCQGEDGV